jgi:hypothetical protein
MIYIYKYPRHMEIVEWKKNNKYRHELHCMCHFVPWGKFNLLAG